MRPRSSNVTKNLTSLIISASVILLLFKRIFDANSNIQIGMNASQT